MHKGEGAMADYDFRTPRLHIAGPLAAGARLELDRDQSHYLTHVLRLAPGDTILVQGAGGGVSTALIALGAGATAALSAFDHLIRAVEKSPSAAKRIRFLRAISDTRPNGGFPASTSACANQRWPPAPFAGSRPSARLCARPLATAASSC